MNIRVLVIDDEPLARVGITTRLSAYSDTLVVGDPRAPAIAMRLEDILKNLGTIWPDEICSRASLIGK